MCANASTTLTGTGVISGHFTRNGGTAISGTTVNLLNSSDTVLASTTTDASGAYTFTGLVTGTYGVRFVSNGSIKGKAKTSHGSANGEYIRGITLNVGTSVSDADAVQIDPAGVIYNSVTRQPVSGAVVTFLFNGSLVSNSWLDQTLGGANSQTTGADGRYSFVLNGTAQTGTYTIAVTSPSGYTFQSQAIPASSGPYDPGLGGGIVAIQPQSTAPSGGDSTTYYLDFSLAVGTTSATTSNGVINNHIPIDPTPVVTIANTTNGAEPSTNGTMTVTLSTASATSTVISYTVGGTATSGADYTALPGSITIAAGQTSGLITIPVIDDSLIEGGETVVVTLSSVTSGTATLSSTPASLTATNTITDNDGNNAPVFSGTNALDGSNAPSYSFNYAENSASGATVGTVVATDADGNTLTYSITSGNGSGWYAINSSTGAITLTTAGAASVANNYEAAPNTQTLTVSVSDGTVATAIEVKLNETNVNDNAPAFTSTNATDANSAPSYAFSYAENSATSVVLGTVSASDLDGGTLTFSITGGNTSGWYAIDPSTGAITLTTAGAASLANDFEQMPNSQTLTVSVSDGVTVTPIEVKLSETNVNDSAPVFTGQNAGSGTSYSFDYAENSATSAVLGSVAASDPDGNTLTFSITGGNTSGWYTINSSTGAITLTTVGAASAANDFEQTPNSQTLTVSVSDGVNTTTVQVVLNETNVNDSAPAFTGQNAGGGTSYSFNYAENSATTAVLGTVAASDPDGGTLTFSITGGDTNGWYTINASTGAITLTTAGAASAANDFETAPNTQTLTVSVSDGTNTTTVQVVLNETNVNDGAPVFTGQNASSGTSYSFNYAENSATSVVLGTVAASDPDGGTLTFSITGGNTNGWYAINPSTGAITLTTAGAASVANDYEAAPNVQTLIVSVSDGTNTTTVSVALNETNVNDSAPVFTGQNAGSGTSYSFDYAENSATTAVLGTVAASDPDGGTLTFSITGGNTNGWYTINASTGAITLTTAGAASAANDFEQTPNAQTLTISVSDGTNTTTVQVVLNETNVNDGAPVFTSTNATDANSAPSYGFSYAENSATTTVLGTVSASDPDGNPLTFSITGGNANGWYAINPSTGAITLTAAGATSLANDYEQTPNSQTLTIAVSDGTNTTPIEVKLSETDVADSAPPAITGPTGGAGAAASGIAVNENQTGVTRLTANTAVTWSITGGNEAGKFRVAADGTITFVAAPDFENPTDSDTNNTYILTVTATDAAGNASAQTVTVTVLNVDDTAALITGPSGGAGAAASALTINEGLTAVTTFAANERVTWAIDGGSDAARFRIDASTGAIVFLWAPDFENPTDSDANNTYIVRVKATDQAGNVSYQTLTVTVVNVDEIGRKMAQIGGRLSADLRGHATHGLSDMLSFNETLMRSNDDVCSDPKARKPLSGSAQANQAGGAIRLNYSDRLSQCGRTAQLFFDAGLTYSKLGAGWNSRVFAGLRYETRVGDNLALGAGLLASRASDKLGSFAQSAISDKSLQFNVYARYRLAKALRTGAFAGLGTTWYDFALTDTDSFTAAGQMRGKRQVYGWMLSGDFNVGDTVVTTDAVVSRAIEKLGTATLAAKYLGESRSGIGLAVGSVDVTRISIPVTAPIMLSGSAHDLGASSRLVLGPGLLCEDSSADSSSLRCGYQLAAKLMASDGAGSRIYADYHWESVAGMQRSLIGLGYGYRFGKNDGLELALELNRGLTGQSGQDNRALLSLRVAH